MSGACGSCTLCCTVMKVAMEPPKPARSPCQFCTKGGCSIYDERPDPCRDFACLWLASQDQPLARLISALRPDRTGVVLEVNSKSYVIAHCHYPAAWRREPMITFLKGVAARTRVLIEPSGEEVLLLDPDGSTRPLNFIGLHPETNERLYKLEIDE
jgi:Fe-S-cluster containining protein